MFKSIRFDDMKKKIIGYHLRLVENQLLKLVRKTIKYLPCLSDMSWSLDNQVVGDRRHIQNFPPNKWKWSKRIRISSFYNSHCFNGPGHWATMADIRNQWKPNMCFLMKDHATKWADSQFLQASESSCQFAGICIWWRNMFTCTLSPQSANSRWWRPPQLKSPDSLMNKWEDKEKDEGWGGV